MNITRSCRGSLSLSPRTLGLLAVAALALAAGVLLGQAALRDRSSPTAVSATVLDEPRSLGEFHLVDHDGQPFTPRRLEGQWTMMFFGFTHCPDVCPTTLSTLDSMHDALEEKAVEPPHVVFVSVDPERDTPQRLREYVPFFNDAFIGVTGTPSDVEVLTRRLGILHVKVDDDESTPGYLVDHTASILLVNPDGKLRAVFGAPHDASRLAADFGRIAGARG